MRTSTVQSEREKRAAYNKAAIEATKEAKTLRFGNMLVDVEAPKELIQGRSIGIIAVDDASYAQIPEDVRYTPRRWQDRLDGGDTVKAPTPEPVKEKKSELYFDVLENLL